MAPTNEAGRLAPVFLEAGTLVAYATPVGQQASVASSSSIAQLAPASELSDLDRTNWNALAIDGVYSYEEDDASNGYNLTSISTAQNLARRMRPADASLARRMEEACAGAECESFDRLVLQNNLIFVALPGISSSQISLSCGGGGYTCCNFAETMLNGNTNKSLRGFGERHPETWQRLLGKGASSSIVMVAWDKAISTLFLNSTSILDPSTSERRGRLVAEALGMHVFWASAPISMLNDPCNHIMPTPYEINNEGLVEMRLNTVWGFGSRLGDVPSIWKERVPKVFYRGKRKYNSAQRGPLFEMGGDPANQVWLDAKDGDHQGPEVSGKHRYALDIGGLSGTTWNALRNKMRMGSLVLRVNSGMADWWHGSLIADQHYLPVKADLSDLKAQFDWAEAHPADAERIAEAGRAVEAEMSTVEAYDTHYERVLVALTSPVGCSRRLPDAGAWELAPTAQVKWTCGAGQRNADASECLAAVVAATSGAANGHIKFLEAADVPPGCSFSRVSGAAMFNSGAGQVGSDRENYQLVCKPATSKGGDKVMPPPTRVRSRAEALAHEDAGDSWLLEAAASGGVRQCSSGRRTALEHECLAAVQEGGRRDGVEVAGPLAIVNDGDYLAVPPGCSWSPVSKRALFNANSSGAERQLTGERECGRTGGAPCYRLACTVEHQAALRASEPYATRTVVLSSRTSGWTLSANECPAGQRNAAKSECLSAVQEAAQSAGLEAPDSIKNVDDGPAAGVPPGCFYSHDSKAAIFNVNPAGRSDESYQGKSNALYPWVCMVDTAAGGERRDRDQDQERETAMQPKLASIDDCAPRIVQVHHKSGTQMVGAAVQAINFVIRHRLNSSCLVHVDENCFYADCPLPPDARVVHIVRNTYDMVVSGYLYDRGGGEGWDSAWLSRPMARPDATRTALDTALDVSSQVFMCRELVQGQSNVIQQGVCHPGAQTLGGGTLGSAGVFSQGVLDVVEAAQDGRFGDAIPPPLDERENYTAFLQRVAPKAGLLSEVIASRASRSTMIGLHTRYRKLSGTFNFGFEDFQTASMDDCTTRWRDVIAAFDYPPNVQEEMATLAAKASCMAATDVQRNAQGHSTSDDQGGLRDQLKLIDSELLGGQLAAEMAELSDAYVNAQRDQDVKLREKSHGANLGTRLRDCHAHPCTDAHWEAKTGESCLNLRAVDHSDSGPQSASQSFDSFGNLARDVCCQFCGQSAP